MNNRIFVNPKICHGQACISGTRIPVRQILRMLANGDRIEDLIESYPSLEREDILACLSYAEDKALANAIAEGRKDRFVDEDKILEILGTEGAIGYEANFKKI